MFVESRHGASSLSSFMMLVIYNYTELSMDEKLRRWGVPPPGVLGINNVKLDPAVRIKL